MRRSRSRRSSTVGSAGTSAKSSAMSRSRAAVSWSGGSGPTAGLEAVADIERIGARRAVVAELHARRVGEVEAVFAVALVGEIAARQDHAQRAAGARVGQRGVEQ